MAYAFTTDEQREVWQVMQGINRAWVEGRMEDLAAFFHQDMVIVTSDFQYRGEGREACAASYKDFCERAMIHDYQELNPNVDVFGDQAVVMYQFDITYVLEGKTHHDKGVDIFMFAREKGRWQAIWRTLVPFPREE